jgi:hypothetical protein
MPLLLGNMAPGRVLTVRGTEQNGKGCCAGYDTNAAAGGGPHAAWYVSFSADAFTPNYLIFVVKQQP